MNKPGAAAVGGAVGLVAGLVGGSLYRHDRGAWIIAGVGLLLGAGVGAVVGKSPPGAPAVTVSQTPVVNPPLV